MKRNELVQEIFSTFEVMKRLTQSQMHATFEKFDLSPSQLHLLMIVENAKSLSLKTLAAKMHMTPGAITQIVDPLVNKGLLARTPDEADRRVCFMSLAPSGSQKVTELKKLRRQTFSKMLTTLDETELESFLHIQQKMISYLENNYIKTKGENA